MPRNTNQLAPWSSVLKKYAKDNVVDLISAVVGKKRTIESSSKFYLNVQSVPQRKHNASSFRRPVGQSPFQKNNRYLL
jgi:hypothetical protein